MNVIKMTTNDEVKYFKSQNAAAKYCNLFQSHVRRGLVEGVTIRKKYKFELLKDPDISAKIILE